MDIILKSYNRAYLLDRVLFSIEQKVKNDDGDVIILDDGTPEKYLKKIKDKYPYVVIKKSPLYHKKSSGTKEKLQPPTQFWREEISHVSDYFLLLEDDIWLVDEIDLDELEIVLKTNNTSFFKLRWWGNDTMINGNYKSLNSQFGLIDYQLPFGAEWVVKNKWYIHSLLIATKLRPKHYFVPLYTVYDVAGHVFSKEFYQFIWPEWQDRIEEMIQLGKAIEWFRKDKRRTVGRSIEEVCATTFLSSSAGSIEKYGFDMDLMNHQLNEAWFDDRFDSVINFPNDYTLDYTASFLRMEHLDKWKEWSIGWRKHFTDMGSHLEKYYNNHEWK